ncbi:MAG: response regulator, partial [Elusimicrobiota bacterium]
KLGFEVLKGENGYEAVAMVHFHKPRLLILDVEMPAKDGFSVLADLQKAKHRPYIIILSAYEDAPNRERALSLGADEVLSKPFNAADLMRKIEGLVKEGRI